MTDSRVVEFKIGEWWVRPALNVVQRGDAEVRIEARSMDVLVCLARHAPRVVSKARIIDEVWGEGAHVGDEVISHAIWELRRALGDDAREPVYIQTIARKGYRLVTDVVYASGSPVPLVGARVDQYEIVEELGSGSMGVVYRARDLRLNRTVAMKFLAPDLTRDTTACRRFQREARLAAALDHPNLAAVFQIGETSEGHQYLVTPYYSGGSLKERLEKGPPFTPTEVIDLGSQIAAGLDEAHRNDIIHRDVKPANILFADRGTVKIADFGIAKLMGATSLTRTGASLGTPAYKSPEQSRGEEVDHRTDIWSLGVVLYEMLTGHRPFRADYEQGVVHAILAEDQPIPTTGATGDPVPEPLQQVVQRAMAKDPAARYPTARDLIDDLQACRNGTATTRIIALRKGKKVRRWLWIAAAVAVLATGGGIGWHYFHPPTQDDATKAEVARLLDQAWKFEWDDDNNDDLDGAETCYLRARELAPDDPEIKARLALLLARLQLLSPEAGRLAKIRQLVDEALAAAPDLWLAHLADAKLRLLEGKPQRAAEAAEAAIARTPTGDRDAYRGRVLLGEALIKLGKTEEGLASMRRAVDIGQGFVRARLVYAYNLWTLGKPDLAASQYTEVLDYQSNNITALNNLGILFDQQGRHHDALPLLKEALRRRPSATTANNLGGVYYNLKNYSKAIKTFQDAIDLDSDLASAYVGLGDTYQILGRRDEAASTFETALQKYDLILAAEGAPEYRYGQRALCAAKLGRFTEAIDQIERSLRKEPNNATLAYNAAQIFAMAGDREQLFEYLRKAVRDLSTLNAFRTDPSFAAFQDDPQFQAILEGEPGT